MIAEEKIAQQVAESYTKLSPLDKAKVEGVMFGLLAGRERKDVESEKQEKAS